MKMNSMDTTLIQANLLKLLMTRKMLVAVVAVEGEVVMVVAVVILELVV